MIRLIVPADTEFVDDIFYDSGVEPLLGSDLRENHLAVAAAHSHIGLVLCSTCVLASYESTTTFSQPSAKGPTFHEKSPPISAIDIGNAWSRHDVRQCGTFPGHRIRFGLTALRNSERRPVGQSESQSTVAKDLNIDLGRYDRKSLLFARGKLFRARRKESSADNISKPCG